MKRYPAFVARFTLAPIISGTFILSSNARASVFELCHVVAGVTAIYLIFGLVLVSVKHRELRLPAVVAMIAGLLEAIPGMPRLHAAAAPLLFAMLVVAAMARPAERSGTARGSLRIFVLPALLGPAIIYGIGYRHQTSEIPLHIALAMLAAAVLLVFCMLVNRKVPVQAKVRRMSSFTIAAVLVQVVAGVAVLVIRMLEIEWGLPLALIRTTHITGAAVLLASSSVLAIQCREWNELRPLGGANRNEAKLEHV